MIVRTRLNNYAWIRIMASIFCIVAVSTILFFGATAFADVPKNVNDSIKNATGFAELNAIATVISNIINPMATISLAFALVRIIMTKDVKTTEKTIAWAKTIIYAFIFFNLIGSFLWFINSMKLQQTVNDELKNKIFSDKKLSSELSKISTTA